jgi:hypothetical protein
MLQDCQSPVKITLSWRAARAPIQSNMVLKKGLMAFKPLQSQLLLCYCCNVQDLASELAGFNGVRESATTISRYGPCEQALS